MLRVAALVNTTARVRFHAILLHSARTIPSIRVWPLKLPSAALCVYDGLKHRASGHGPDYLFKPLLAWVLPPSIRRLILLDCDTVPLRDVRELFDQFASFCASAVIGLVREQSLTYQRSLNVTGFNGGVQLHHLERMRASDSYMSALEQVAAGRDGRDKGWHKAGFLGDQTLYSFLAADHSNAGLVHTLPCEWNRQLGSDFLMLNRHADTVDASMSLDAPRFGFTNAIVHTCPRCGVLHANLGPLKCIARLMHANPACATWEALRLALASPNRTSGRLHDLLIGACPRLPEAQRGPFLGALERFFADCCVPGYKGPLRPPEGPSGSSAVTAAMRRVRRRSNAG